MHVSDAKKMSNWCPFCRPQFVLITKTFYYREKIMKKCIFCISIVLIAAAAAIAQETLTKNTLNFSEGQKPAPATIKDIEWLAGGWRGFAFGGISEDMYSKPEGGTMVGTYRLIKDGKPIFYEFVLIAEEKGSLVIRLKHFNPDLTGWEEKDKSVSFWFIKKDKSRMYFEGMTFEPKGRNALNIYLAIKNKDGSIVEETFSYKRVKI